MKKRIVFDVSRLTLPLMALLVGCPEPDTAIGTLATTDVPTGSSTHTQGGTGEPTTSEPTSSSSATTTTSSTTATTTSSTTATTTSSTTAEETTAESTTFSSTNGATTLETTTADTTTGAEETCLEFTSTPDSQFDAFLASLQLNAVSPATDDTRPSGLSVAIVVDGVLMHAGGVGTRAKQGHVLAQEPVGADTLFWIASTSKWMSGAMVSTLVEDGLLDFDAPVTSVLPEYTETMGKQNDITLHHLLTMTSGLSDANPCWLLSVSTSAPSRCLVFSDGPGTVLQNLFDPDVLPSKPWNMFNSTEKNGPPGNSWEYSNFGIMLAGRMAEVAGGAPFPDLVAARIFNPAQMCSATYDPSVMIDSGDYAVGSGQDGLDGVCLEPNLGHDSLAPWEPDELACRARDPNGGVRGSAVDVGRFAAAFLADLHGQDIMMGEAAAQRMLCPGGGKVDQGCIGRVPNDPNVDFSDTYGYTNFHHVRRGYDVYTHGGGRPGYGSLFWIVPERNFAVVILANEKYTAYTAAPLAESAMACWLDDQC